MANKKINLIALKTTGLIFDEKNPLASTNDLIYQINVVKAELNDKNQLVLDAQNKILVSEEKVFYFNDVSIVEKINHVVAKQQENKNASASSLFQFPEEDLALVNAHGKSFKEQLPLIKEFLANDDIIAWNAFNFTAKALNISFQQNQAASLTNLFFDPMLYVSLSIPFYSSSSPFENWTALKSIALDSVFEYATKVPASDKSSLIKLLTIFNYLLQKSNLPNEYQNWLLTSEEIIQAKNEPILLFKNKLSSSQSAYYDLLIGSNRLVSLQELAKKRVNPIAGTISIDNQELEVLQIPLEKTVFVNNITSKVQPQRFLTTWMVDNLPHNGMTIAADSLQVLTLINKKKLNAKQAN